MSSAQFNSSMSKNSWYIRGCKYGEHQVIYDDLFHLDIAKSNHCSVRGSNTVVFLHLHVGSVSTCTQKMIRYETQWFPIKI